MYFVNVLGDDNFEPTAKEQDSSVLSIRGLAGHLDVGEVDGALLNRGRPVVGLRFYVGVLYHAAAPLV